MIVKWIQLKKNQNKLNGVLESHYRDLYPLAYAWTQESDLAQDLVQETLVKALEKADQIQSFEQIERWLCKIMHNLFYDRCRHSAKWQFEQMEDLDGHFVSESVESLYIKHQTVNNIHDAIGKLGLDQREVVTLVDLQGYSYQEVAEILEVPVGTVMSRLARARKQLKKMIQTEEMTFSFQQNLVQLKGRKDA